MFTLSIETLSYLLYSSIFLLIILIILSLRSEMRVTRLLRGKEGHSLEASIHAIQQGLTHQETFEKEIKSYMKNVEHRLTHSVRGVYVVRFNAFKGTGSGGNQSFAAAFLNEKGDGVVVSTLSARERNSVFAKSVASFKSESELIPEEVEAIDGARKSLSL